MSRARTRSADLPVTNLGDRVMYDDPFPRYAWLRERHPVSLVKMEQVVWGHAYMLTRYDDVQLLHSDRRFSSDPAKQGNEWVLRHLPRMFRLLTDSMVFKDDPEHARLRGLVQRAFTPKLIRTMADDIERVAERLLDGLARRGGSAVDLIEDFAVQLPLAVIAEMLGVDDADREEFHVLTKRFTERAADGPVAIVRAIPDGRRMIRLFERIADQRRREPDDRIVSALVRANDEGDQLDDHELLAMIFLLLLAGHDTTQNLIGTGTVALIEHPAQLARLREDPEGIDVAVEELLRFCTPVPCGAVRYLLEDVEVSGTVVAKGSRVLGMLISANRDESVFEAPDELDVGRSPNRHLSFAFGSHHCLGYQLAKLEAKATIGGLLRRFDHLELAVPGEQLRYRRNQTLRGFTELPVHLR